MKPVSPFTMGYRLENPIAIGILRWGKNRTGVVNDTRVVETNPEGAEMIPDFCEPLISVELYERVQRLRQARSEQIKRSRTQKAMASKEGSGKLIAPQARGLTLRYLLSGLVRCRNCNASLRPVPSGRRSKAGRQYVYYSCPRHYDGSCANNRHVPEDHLREAVLSRLRARLFPAPGHSDPAPSWLPELLCQVRQEWQRYQDDEPERMADDHQALEQMEQQLSGWALSLGNPQLPASVRTDIEARYEQGKRQQQELMQSAAVRQAWQAHLDRILNTRAVLVELQRLDEVLSGNNATLGNLELSRQIDVIVCFPDGRVELRATYVGLFPGAVELLSRLSDSQLTEPTPVEESSLKPVQPRRRGRLRLSSLLAGSQQLGGVDTALDPERFAQLPPSFRWTEAFIMEAKPSWAEANAAEVAQQRASGLTMEQLAQRFDRTVPTIRQALRHAKAKDPSLSGLPTKMPRRRWEEDHAAEVARLRAEGKKMKELVSHFGKSEPTIRKALNLAAKNSLRSPGKDSDRTNPE